MTDQEKPDVGIRIRALREQRGLSLRALAERCDLSINAISRIERGENSPTVSSLHLLANALGVPITDFFQDTPEKTIVFVKSDRRTSFRRNGLVMESLGIGLRNQHLEPFLMTIEPGAGDLSDPIVHSGQEFVYCLRGEIEYHVGDTPYHLQAGDSLLFEASQSHCFTNRSTKTAITLVIFQVADGSHAAHPPHLEG
jgi:transcriptional regulator with XRE-family HTH domain